MENVAEWIKNIGSGDGHGHGHGSGCGFGCGSGSGYGFSHGSGFGCGDGSGFGSGGGFGDGSGFGIDVFEDKKVYLIDGIMTIIEHIKDSFAKGFILNSDLTLTPCFVAKGNGYFAHGETLKEAREALRAKIFENMDSDEAINAFLEKFKKEEKYPGTEFFEWHHYLTGSCLMGRQSFVRNKGLNLDDTYTVEEFIAICEDDYGGEVIKQLKEKWENS